MSKQDAKSKSGSLDDNVEELLAQMAAGKVITDEGALTAEEVEARKPKPAFSGSELLDDGAKARAAAEAAAAARAREEEAAIKDGQPLSDGGTVAKSPLAEDSDGAGRLDNPVPTPENNLGGIPPESVNSAELAADVVAPEVANVDAGDGTEPSDAGGVASSAPSAGDSGRGEPVPELADQLDNLLSGVDAAGQGEELAMETLEMDAAESPAPPAESKDAGGAIDSLNAELEAAAAKVEEIDRSTEAPPVAREPEEEEPAPHPSHEPAQEPVPQPDHQAAAATAAPGVASASQSPVETPAAKAEPSAPVVVEPKGPNVLRKLSARVGAVAGDATLSALAAASLPLKSMSRGARDTVGWVGLWTAFLGVCVWFYVLVLHTPAPAFVPEAAIKVVDQAAEGGEGGGHAEKPAKKDDGHAKAGAKPASKPAAKPAKKDDGHAPAGGH
ncbi:MAG: hypothetical protein JNL50_08000 [Phycisphaerae bacterium]|nr:hypothetical protein [Phycisphaerae bacterium]